MNKGLSKVLLLAGLSAFSFSAQCAEITTNAARMQAMDKVTGRVNEIMVAVNSKINFGDFSLVLRSCKKRPAEETPENFAFIDVTDKSFGTEEYNIFRGWILSSTPGINAIEHPIYDVWLLECVDADIKEAQILSKEELEKRDTLPTKVAIQEESREKQKIEENEIQDDDGQPSVLHIKEFINEDRDIEKDIVVPAYISDSSSDYVSEIEEGEEPENLLLFTKIQEIKDSKDVNNQDEQLLKDIDSELKALKAN